jgi:hypothetical protein
VWSERLQALLAHERLQTQIIVDADLVAIRDDPWYATAIQCAIKSVGAYELAIAMKTIALKVARATD